MAKFKPYKFKPLDEFDLDIPKDRRAEALEAAAEYLRTAMLDYIGEGSSPVAGGQWVKKLSKDYKDKKLEESSVSFANLELSGHLLDNLSVDVSGNQIVIDVDDDDKGKALGHITGEYGSGKMKDGPKPRQFMPQPGESFKRDIISNLKKILQDFEE